jgi:hypothetical protein
MKSIFLTVTLSLAASGAFAYKPAVEKDFSEMASQGCSNRDADFIIRGIVSSADENTLVLSDASGARSTSTSTRTLSVTLPGRGPLARAKGVFTNSKYEAADQRLNELRTTQTPVVVTLKCKGNGTPIARNIAYQNSDGSQSSITY